MSYDNKLEEGDTMGTFGSMVLVLGIGVPWFIGVSVIISWIGETFF